MISALWLAVWWLRCKATHIKIDNHKILLIKGLLAKHTSEVRHRDVRNVQVHQSLFQRIMGVGSVEIATSATCGTEIVISGIPNPTRVRDLIEKYAAR